MSHDCHIYVTYTCHMYFTYLSHICHIYVKISRDPQTILVKEGKKGHLHFCQHIFLAEFYCLCFWNCSMAAIL